MVNDRRRLDKEEIEVLVKDIGNIKKALGEAEPQPRADTYSALGLKPTYEPENQKVRVEAILDPHTLGLWSVSEGGLEPPSPFGH